MTIILDQCLQSLLEEKKTISYSLPRYAQVCSLHSVIYNGIYKCGVNLILTENYGYRAFCSSSVNVFPTKFSFWLALSHILTRLWSGHRALIVNVDTRVLCPYELMPRCLSLDGSSDSRRELNGQRILCDRCARRINTGLSLCFIDTDSIFRLNRLEQERQEARRQLGEVSMLRSGSTFENCLLWPFIIFLPWQRKYKFKYKYTKIK